jgi:hypothetical protein
MPIFLGGVVRWAVDRYLRQKHRHANLTEEQLTAEGDKSPGVLLASGYIAGGAIAGILIAFIAGLADANAKGPVAWLAWFNPALWLAEFNLAIANFTTRNPFVSGASADWLSLLPFAVLIALLYLTGRDVLLARRSGAR